MVRVMDPPVGAVRGAERGQPGFQGQPVSCEGSHARDLHQFKFFFTLMGNHGLTMTPA
ncbi:hypothetical protein GCM10022398_19810 [Acetobacter lovaniensis]